jgi:hypothetical protein
MPGGCQAISEAIRGRLSAIRPIVLVPIQHQPLRLAIDAYKGFDERQASWLKVKIEPVG